MIAAMDAVVVGFVEIPLPDEAWTGKSGLLRQEDLPTQNPRAENARPKDSEPDPGFNPFGPHRAPEPQVQQLFETAAGFRAQANVLRAL